MTTFTREQIYQALFGYISPLLAPGAVAGPPDGGNAAGTGLPASPGMPTSDRPFNMVSREVIEVQRVPPLLQPVLFMDEAMEDYTRDGNGLYHRRWTVYFHVGCTSSRGTAASTILNPLLDILEDAIPPLDDNLLDLGDLLDTAQFAGLSIKNLGNNAIDSGQRQAVAYVPFEIVFG